MLKIVTQYHSRSEPTVWKVASRLPEPEDMSLELAVSVAYRDLRGFFERAGLGDPRRRRITKDDASFAGRLLVQRVGWHFRVGRRLLEIAHPEGLWPHPSFRLSPSATPSDDEIMAATVLVDWDVLLVQEGEAPAHWVLSGDVPDCDDVRPDPDRVWHRLLRVTPDRTYAYAEGVGWCYLWGRRWHDQTRWWDEN